MSAPKKLSRVVTRVLVLSIFASLCVAGMFWYLIVAQQVRVPYMQPYDLPQESSTVETEQYAALESPLFWISRLPVPEIDAPEGEPAQTEAGSIEGVQLLGIIVRDSVRTALFGVDNKIKKVIKGDEVNGWVVEHVFADKVVLMADGQEAELSIARERPDSIKLERAAP